MQSNSCRWDSAEPCQTCTKIICASCESKESCETCVMENEDFCFAFCDFAIEPVLSDINVDFPEKYAVIRCKRSRKETFDPDYYPGFCASHCQMFASIQNEYFSMSESKKKAIYHMISNKVCNMLKIQGVLNNGNSVWDIFSLINSPVGYMCINPMYFALFLQTFMSEQFIRQVVFKMDTETMKKLQNGSSYSFLAEILLRPNNFKWLCDRNPELRVLNWNMLYYKISSMFLMCTPPDSPATIPPFSPDWAEQWHMVAKESQRLQAKEWTIEVIGLWDNFLFMMEFVVKMVNREILNSVKPDGQPKTMNIFVDSYLPIVEKLTCIR